MNLLKKISFIVNTKNVTIHRYFRSSDKKFLALTTPTQQNNDHPVDLSYNSYETVTRNNEANPIIIMHGLFGSKQNWRSLSKALHSKTHPTRKVFAVDARNHGESPHTTEHNYENLANDIHQFCHQQAIERAVFIGHSMGGRAMMSFVLKYPEFIEKAIIVDISPVQASPSLEGLGNIFAAMNQVKISNKLPMSGGRAEANRQLMGAIADKETRDFVLLNLIKDPNNGEFDWRINVKSLHANFVEYISRFPNHLMEKQFNGDVLFIGGSNSDYIKPEQLPAIRKIFPNAKLEFVDAGHLLHVEKPNDFLKLVLNFVNV